MSEIEKNLPDPLDRLGLLLDHAQGMGMALTCEDFDTINERAKKNYYNALLYVLMDAQTAFSELVRAQAKETA
jgi:hypothetical protein